MGPVTRRGMASANGGERVADSMAHMQTPPGRHARHSNSPPHTPTRAHTMLGMREARTAPMEMVVPRGRLPGARARRGRMVQRLLRTIQPNRTCRPGIDPGHTRWLARPSGSAHRFLQGRPQCKQGEAGAEHLAIFCPAVRVTWRILCPTYINWWPGWLLPSEHPIAQRQQALRFCHAVAFLGCALGTAEAPNAEVGTRLILKQMLSRNVPCMTLIPELHDALVTETSEALMALHQNVPLRETAEDRFTVAGDTCGACGADRPTVVQTWCGPHPQRGATASNGSPRAGLRTQVPIPDGSVVLALRSRRSPAAWPFQARGPRGMPITDSHLPNNVLWTEQRCPACRQWLLIARASRNIETGELLRSDRLPGVLANDAIPEDDYIVSFDGGARHRSPNATLPEDGPRAVGAGAAIWGQADHNGIRQYLAQLTASVPSLSSSMAAEAIGLRAGLALAAYTLGRVRNIGVLGDNLPVMRFAAANGRVRTPGIWEILEAPPRPRCHLAVAVQMARCTELLQQSCRYFSHAWHTKSGGTSCRRGLATQSAHMD